MKSSMFIVAMFTITFLLNPSTSIAKNKKKDSYFILKSNSNRERVIKDSLSYLKDSVKEIKKIKINGNIVILVWNNQPSDFSLINKGAAFKAHKAINLGVHVWSVPKIHTGWNEAVGYICETTARYGKVQSSSCK